jgi:hypothetical protein
VNGDDPDAPHSTFSQSSKEVREHICAYRWICGVYICDNPADALCVNVKKSETYVICWNAIFQVFESNRIYLC